MPAIAADSLVACPGGARPAHSIAPGDRVSTLAGSRRVVWTGTRRLQGRALMEAPSLGPVTLRLGGFGHGPELRVAPHTRVTTSPGMLAYAADVARSGLGEIMPTIACAYVSFIFDETEQIRANGVWVECLRPDDPPSADVAASRTQLYRLFPSLARRSPRTSILTPRIG